MIIVDTLELVYSGSVISLGNFDGVHRGHRFLIEKTKNIALENGKRSGIVTFYPHPLTLNKEPFPYFLTSISEKLYLLKKLNLDFIFIKKFNEDFKKLTPKEFVVFLKEVLKPSIVVIGEDFKFGRGREGDVYFLKKKMDKVEIVEKFEIDHEEVSSTNIRDLIYTGSLRRANQMLGYKYFVSGYKIKGKGYGKRIGFPTINLKPVTEWKIIPHDGVYGGWSGFHSPLKAAIYVGSSPTLKMNEKTIEFHFVEQGWEDRRFYRIFFDSWFTEEKKFHTRDELIDSIKSYVETVKRRTGNWQKEFSGETLIS